MGNELSLDDLNEVPADFLAESREIYNSMMINKEEEWSSETEHRFEEIAQKWADNLPLMELSHKITTSVFSPLPTAFEIVKEGKTVRQTLFSEYTDEATGYVFQHTVDFGRALNELRKYISRVLISKTEPKPSSTNTTSDINVALPNNDEETKEDSEVVAGSSTGGIVEGTKKKAVKKGKKKRDRERKQAAAKIAPSKITSYKMYTLQSFKSTDARNVPDSSKSRCEIVMEQGFLDIKVTATFDRPDGPNVNCLDHIVRYIRAIQSNYKHFVPILEELLDFESRSEASILEDGSSLLDYLQAETVRNQLCRQWLNVMTNKDLTERFEKLLKTKESPDDVYDKDEPTTEKENCSKRNQKKKKPVTKPTIE